MRYGIVSGILLILSVIDFALAAPILVQEKRQTSVDEVHMPKDVITVLGKRMDDDFEEFSRLVDGYFRPWKKLVASSSSVPLGPDHGPTNAVQAPVPDPAPSDAHAPPNLAPPGPDHGLTNVMQAPAPNQVSSTTNPIPLIILSSSESSPAASSALSDSEDYGWLFKPEGDDKIDTATSSGHGLDHELSSVPTGPDHGSTDVVQAPTPDPVSSTAKPNQLMKPSSSKSLPIESSALSDSKYKWLSEPEGTQIIDFKLSQPNSNKRPSTDMDPDPDYVWGLWKAYADRLRAGLGQTSEYQAVHVQQPAPGPSRDSGFDLNYPPVPAPVVHPPSTSAGLPTQPEHEVVIPSESSPNPTQPVDLQAAVYAAKGKQKESRRISGTTRDVGNAAQRELQSDESSLDPGK